jgi:hypothetical protein
MDRTRTGDTADLSGGLAVSEVSLRSVVRAHREGDDVGGQPAMAVPAEGAGELGIANDPSGLPNTSAVEVGDLLKRPDLRSLTVGVDRVLVGVGWGCHARDCLGV